MFIGTSSPKYLGGHSMGYWLLATNLIPGVRFGYLEAVPRTCVERHNPQYRPISKNRVSLAFSAVCIIFLDFGASGEFLLTCFVGGAWALRSPKYGSLRYWLRENTLRSLWHAVLKRPAHPGTQTRSEWFQHPLRVHTCNYT